MKKIVLNKEQKKAIYGLNWLFYGKLSSGRTFLLKYLKIEKVKYRIIGEDYYREQ